MGKFGTAWRCFWHILKDESFRKEVEQKLTPGEGKILPPPKKDLEKAWTLLGLLQEEGRLIDFLKEDLSACPDEQVGAAVRNIHENCHRLLQKFFEIKPIIEGEEGASIRVEEGFDSASIKLVGNVKGKPPWQGIIRHHGWKIQEKKDLPERVAPFVLAYAEVEME